MSNDIKALIARLRERRNIVLGPDIDSNDAADAIEAAEARVKGLEEVMEDTARYFDARSELFTSDADCAMYMAQKLRAALSTAPAQEPSHDDK
jgi:hypothetical protein